MLNMSSRRDPMYMPHPMKANVITAQLMYQYLVKAVLDNAPRYQSSRSVSSWREGCADRLCERLAARREDLIKQHDARVQAEQASIKEEFARRAKEQADNTPKGLPAHHESEVKAGYERMAAGAYDRSGPKPEAHEPNRPEVNPNDNWTPTGAPVAEPETGCAMVLASVYDESEREANYEIAHGLPAGFLAERRAARAERERLAAEREAKEEVAEVEKPVKQETERQRLSRERKENEEWAKNRRRWMREDAAEQRKAWRASGEDAFAVHVDYAFVAEP